ncbi:GDSL-type esterase/lipase family protein [Myroides albus]|uniref:GDSL-type esterase/lipase family protein n=1 Tax=Myroides albus TaxID=2562892 RepID=UPI002158F58F|nr:GDSL-type esterase/lipase family protein [Myroides albus]UVD79164.1 GDSL-type esterase/lipase family protein [Myroides albus]
MNIKCIVFCCLFFCSTLVAQQIDKKHFSYKYYHMVDIFNHMANSENEIVFLGDSITEQGPWYELFRGLDYPVVNRGISGDTTDGVLFRLGEVVESKPKVIFLLIGTNDIYYKRSVDYIVSRIEQIVSVIKANSPTSQIVLQSILPTYKRTERPLDTIKKINKQLRVLAKKEHIAYLDLFPFFLNNEGKQLNEDYSLDGLHLNAKGYALWVDLIKKESLL